MTINGANYINLATSSAPIPPADNTVAATDTDLYAGQQLIGIAPDFKPVFLYQYSLAVEKQLGSNVISLTYVGNTGRRLPSVPNVQSYVSCTDPGSAACASQLPYPNLPWNFIAGMWESTAQSSYHAMEASFRRRFRAGLTANANWTWSHMLDNSQVPMEGPGGGAVDCNQACYEDNPGRPANLRQGWLEDLRLWQRRPGPAPSRFGDDQL